MGNFKKLLEYFVAHLEYAKTNNTSNRGYDDYIKPIKGFKKSGQGHKGYAIQKQIEQWSSFDEGKVLISIQSGFKFTTASTYLQWENCGVDICAVWDDNKNKEEIKALYVVDKDYNSSERIIEKTISELGLFDGKTFNTILEEFYNAFASQLRINRVSMYIQLLKTNYNLIFTGAPGTGKTYLAREIAAEMIGCNKDDLNDRDQFGFVQFHPSYDYTDFVEGLRPMLSGGFQRTDGTFKAFCAKAAIAETKDAEKVKKQEIKEEDKRKYVFVIDEINRGEISKIFGELFFSIDPGYRKPEDRVRVKTQYQNLIRKGEKIKDDAGNDTADDYLFTKGFYVPSNVYIIGTMNDIDRSVESMDFAFRRRFAFYEILAKDRQEDILSKLSNKDEAIKKMTNLNAAIEKQEGFGPSYHIGPAYFKQIEKYNGDWEQLWKNHLYGVLFEYLRGVPDYKTILNEWKVEFDK